MQPARATLDEYSCFISSPQAEGVWSIRIELSEAQTTSLARFLNIDSYRLTNHRAHYYYASGRAPFYGYEDRPPILLPRLFAYLRSALPQTLKDGLPGLTSRDDSRLPGPVLFQQRRSYRFFDEVLTPPRRLSPIKRKRLGSAIHTYEQCFLRCRFAPVPEDVSKIDVVCLNPLTYFQIAEEPPAIRVSSPCEATLNRIGDILDSIIPDRLSTELTKIFSPENTLMGMYLPILQLVPLNSILRDKTAAANLRQALDEAGERRFVHAIRATGIAAEEILVEIYETYLREKAPQAPLGNIIHHLSVRIQEVLHGIRKPKESALTAARKQIGKAIEAEKQSEKNVALLLLAEQLQKNILPTLEILKQSLDESPAINLKTQEMSLFPSNVRRCLSELVILRNRVSHRVERVVSVAPVGYVDTAIALRDYIVVAKWWENERKKINYKTERKSIIRETVERSKSPDSEIPPNQIEVASDH